MALVRKTLSIATLGAVSFRSKKEKLRRADRARWEAEAELQREHDAREAAERRVAKAEERLKRAASDATRSADALAKVKRKRRRSRIEHLVEASAPLARSGATAVHDATTDAMHRSRKAARKARKSADKTSAKARKSARKAAASTKHAVGPQVEKLTAKVKDAIDV